MAAWEKTVCKLWKNCRKFLPVLADSLIGGNTLLWMFLTWNTRWHFGEISLKIQRKFLESPSFTCGISCSWEREWFAQQIKWINENSEKILRNFRYNSGNLSWSWDRKLTPKTNFSVNSWKRWFWKRKMYQHNESNKIKILIFIQNFHWNVVKILKSSCTAAAFVHVALPQVTSIVQIWVSEKSGKT